MTDWAPTVYREDAEPVTGVSETYPTPVAPEKSKPTASAVLTPIGSAEKSCPVFGEIGVPPGDP